MRLIMVRHGETRENRESITQGQSPGHLTKKGIEQTQLLAQRLKDQHFDYIYCSDLKRTKDTLSAIIKFHKDTPVSYEPNLRERSKGVLEGKPWTEAHAYFEDNGLDWFEDRPPKGENIHDIRKRAFDFFDKNCSECSDKTVLWVTHGGIIYQILNKVMGLGKKDIKLKHTSVTIVDVNTKGECSVGLLNCAKHLS